MTQQEWENATPEERAAEMERCKDARYFYNTYINPNAKTLSPRERHSRIRMAQIRMKGRREDLK